MNDDESTLRRNWVPAGCRLPASVAWLILKFAIFAYLSMGDFEIINVAYQQF